MINDSRMEIGYYYYGFCYSFTLDKGGSWLYGLFLID